MNYDDYVAEREFVTECPHGRINPDLCGICYVTNMGIERARQRQAELNG